MAENLNTLIKKNRGGVNLYLAEKVGVRGFNDTTNGQGFFQAIQELQRLLGANTIIQVNDCETSGDWSESSNGTFDMAVAATGNRVGTNCLSLTATAATTGTQYVQTYLIDESAYIPFNPMGKRQMDWRDTDYIGFWKHAESSAHFGTDGELQFAIVNDGVVSALQDVDGTAGTEHHWCQIDISGLDRDKVEAIRFYGDNTNVGEVTYIDEILRYKYQFNGGPLYGAALPITSGTTLSENHWCAWSINGVAASASAAAVTDIGPCYLGAATALGTATRSVWAQFPGRFFFLVQANAATVAGEGLEWAANGLAAGVSDGVEEVCWAKGLEAAGAQYDHIFACFDTGGRYIS
jgi:hypothetical protein